MTYLRSVVRVALIVPCFVLLSSLPAFAQQPTLNAFATGTVVTVQWTPVAGAAVYEVEVGGAVSGAVTVPASPTQYALNAAPGVYLIRVRARAGNLVGPFSNVVTVTVGGAPAPAPPPPPGSTGNRTPNPAPGTILPLPGYGPAVVNSLAAQFPGALRASCGSNEWLYRLVYALRLMDTRWGLNWKRGHFGDLSQDVVTYNFGAGPDEGNTEVYIIDVISGHCGGNPGPNWQDQTRATRDAGTIGRWTLLPILPFLPPGAPR